jgi:SAM-dependent methyltransferase
MPKQYDQPYFDRWYRDPRRRVKSPLVLERKVRMVVAIAEHHLGHALGSVLDVGCGEAAWLAPLRKLRPRVRYLGLDSSNYAVARYGRARNVRHCAFGQLAEQRFDDPVDLLVCSDVMHYLPTVELERGLAGFAELCHGVAFLEVFCKGDDFVGDREGFVARSAAWYRRAFARAGFTHAGSHCYLSRALRERASALELAAQ